MAESRLVRDYYPLAKAAELLDCEDNDLIHLAANGGVQLFVLADNWVAKRIYQYDYSIVPGDDLQTYLKPIYRGPTPPEKPDAHDPDYAVKNAKWFLNHDCQDIAIGNMVDYRKHGKYRIMYEMTFDGPVPVAKKCFEEYRIRPETAKIEIDMYRYCLSRHWDAAGEAQNMFLIPENEPLVQDAFNSGELVVLTENIKRLQEGETSPDPKAEAVNSKRLASLLKFIIGMAVSIYKYDPAKKNNALQEIMQDLDSVGVGLDAQTIRDILKEAATHLPPTPHKS